MKITVITLIVTALGISACTASMHTAGATNDDIYYTPSGHSSQVAVKENPISNSNNGTVSNNNRTSTTGQMSDYEKYRMSQESQMLANPDSNSVKSAGNNSQENPN